MDRRCNLIKMSKDFDWYYENKYITVRDGNACVRDGNNYIVTASGVPKHELGFETYVVVDKDLNIIESPLEGLKPSIETAAHLHALESKPFTCKASVHVHPPSTVSLFGIVEKSESITLALENSLNSNWPELFRYTRIGKTVDFLQPGSHELHNKIDESFKINLINNTFPDIIVLQRHGVLAIGENLEQCREHIERLEHISAILLKMLMAGLSLKEIL